MRVEALFRLLGGDDFEELLLARGLPDGGEQFALGVRGLASLTATASRRRGRRPDGPRCRPE
jgi:hypothetical protein